MQRSHSPPTSTLILTPGQSPSNVYIEKIPKPFLPMIFYCMGYPFGQFGSTALVTSSPNISCFPNRLVAEAELEKEKASTSYKLGHNTVPSPLLLVKQ